MSVMHVPRLIAPGFTLGAALSNRTQERPCASFPVTTRRIGLTASAIARLLIGRLRKLDESQLHCHYHERSTGSAPAPHHEGISRASNSRHRPDCRPRADERVSECCKRTDAQFSEPHDQDHRWSEPGRVLTLCRRASEAVLWATGRGSTEIWPWR